MNLCILSTTSKPAQTLLSIYVPANIKFLFSIGDGAFNEIKASGTLFDNEIKAYGTLCNNEIKAYGTLCNNEIMAYGNL
jgi:hypothetical protein